MITPTWKIVKREMFLGGEVREHTTIVTQNPWLMPAMERHDHDVAEKIWTAQQREKDNTRECQCGVCQSQQATSKA